MRRYVVTFESQAFSSTEAVDAAGYSISEGIATFWDDQDQVVFWIPLARIVHVRSVALAEDAKPLYAMAGPS